MSVFDNISGLSLYHYQSCPYCAMTRTAIDDSGLDIERRNIKSDAGHRADLLKQGGKTQVPCLRIDQHDGETQWLYESTAIIQFIHQYANQAGVLI